MQKIRILEEMPAILTTDRTWLQFNKPVIKPGAIVALPDDAVLVLCGKAREHYEEYLAMLPPPLDEIEEKAVAKKEAKKHVRQPN